MTDPEPRERASPALEAWKRRMWTACLALMPLGLALVITGAALGWGRTPMLGFLLGGGGVFLLVLGALCGKFAAAGPYPEGLR
ncbi:MAG TPA: hypothetical protein VHI93_03725 [Candidatus Thermoplasmatota archaeon]|nr:hypothetical protein [Candidatus Thermoplasmatota archaeon]